VIAAERCGLALDQRNDDFDVAESGGVERAAQILRGGYDRRRRLLPQNLVAKLDSA
jgi:hypothetical protein